MSLIIPSLLRLKWGFFRCCLTFFKAAAIRLDEFDVVGDHLYSAPFGPFIGFPLGMIQDSGNSYFSALVQMLLADLREAVETGHLDPAGLFFACPKCQIERGDGLPFRIEMDIRIISQVSC
jgi:hypothetical protein